MRIRIAIITILLALSCYAIVVVMMWQTNPRTMRVEEDIEFVPVVVARFFKNWLAWTKGSLISRSWIPCRLPRQSC